MPELPEVETIMLGITPFLEGATITKLNLNRSAVSKTIQKKRIW